MGFKPRPRSGTQPFTDETVQFLIDLQDNNDRDWFAANKPRYEQCVREPAREFIRQLAPHIAKVSPQFDASDKRVGAALMRVHRDTRFSADKTPYKTNVGMHFRHRAGKDVHAPGLYVHIALDECFIGVGCWRPASPSLAGIRQRIIKYPKEWQAARDDRRFRQYFELTGESLKRMPRGIADDEPYAADLRRKDHTAMAELSMNDVLSPGLVEFCAERFVAARPYVGFLTRAVGVSF